MPTSLERIPPTKQLQTLDLVAPGHLGVNTIQASSLLDPSYCITANNAVVDTSGRLAARSGIVRQTTTPVGTTVYISQGANFTDLLLHFDGSNGQITTVDSSPNAFAVTMSGAAALTTTNPKFGTASLALPSALLSADNYVYTPMTALGPLDIFATNNWTFECFFNITGATGLSLILATIGARLDGAPDHSMVISASYSGGTLTVSAQDLSAFIGSITLSTTTTTTLNTWHHMALVNNAGVTTIYLDGVPSITTTPVWVPGNYQGLIASANIIQGWTGRFSGSTTTQAGQIDELRISATAVYTGAFTPPTAPFVAGSPNPQGAITGTLSAPWAGTTGQYTILWDTGQQTLGTFTNGSSSVTWTPGLFSATAGSGVVLTTPILSSFEYNQGNGSFQEIVAWSGGISNNVANPLANNKKGSVNVTNGQWYFQNFNNKVIGLQAGQKPIVWNGTGNFATVVESAGTAPTGGIGTSAFGRLWVVDADGQTIKYSGLLDETDWSTTDGNAGIIDMHTIWSNGTDTVTAIAAFNASLVVFGTNHIVFFTDGRGSLLGLDPTQAYVFDTIFSTGCYSQWTVQNIGQGDMLFLGPNGVQSLSNLNTNRSFPQGNVSKYIRDTLLSQIASETTATISSSYNNLTGQYYLCLPNSGLVWCIDMRRKYTDQMGETCAVCTPWLMRVTATNSTHNNLTYFARTIGTIGLYSGNTDEGQPYVFTYLSPWLDLGEEVAQHLKMLKRMEAIVFAGGAQSITFAYNTDFNKTAQSVVLNVNSSGANSQYAIGQYGIAQYGGGSTLALLKYPAHARGQYYQVGLASTVANIFALQQIQLAVKIGRVA